MALCLLSQSQLVTSGYNFETLPVRCLFSPPSTSGDTARFRKSDIVFEMTVTLAIGGYA